MKIFGGLRFLRDTSEEKIKMSHRSAFLDRSDFEETSICLIFRD